MTKRKLKKRSNVLMLFYKPTSTNNLNVKK